MLADSGRRLLTSAQRQPWIDRREPLEKMTSDELDVETIAGVSYLHVDSDRIDACLRHYREHRINWLVVNAVRGYKLLDVDFLRGHNYVTHISIVPPLSSDLDLTGLDSLRELRGLMSDAANLGSLARFPKLESFWGTWSPRLELSACKGLEILSLGCYKAKTGDLTTFPDLPALRELGLIQSAIGSIRGIERFRGLRKLTLAYFTKLRSVAEVAHLPDLEDLDVHVCRKIEDHEAVRVLKKLRVLKYNDCGQMPSVAFVNEMPALEFFAFVGTNVLDGDLGPLIRLKYAGFSEKKHYSHTRKQLDELMRPHGGAAIVRLRGE